MDDLSDLRDRFARTITVLDGGLSTELEAQGHDLLSRLWSARLLRDEPEAIVDAHRAFFTAGAQVATTSSYQASFQGFEQAGIDREAATKLLRRSVSLAQTARDEVRPEDGLVAASIGPYGAMLADGSEYRGDYGVSVKELREFHRPRLQVLGTTGADLFAVETIPCLAEVEALCAELAGSGHPAWLSISAQGDKTAAGEPLIEAYAMAAAVDEFVAVGVNCVSPDGVVPALDVARRVTRKPLVAYANSGREWNAVSREWEGEPTLTVAVVGGWKRAGATMIGGCCGVSPADIARIAASLERSTPRWARKSPAERADPFV